MVMLEGGDRTGCAYDRWNGVGVGPDLVLIGFLGKNVKRLVKETSLVLISKVEAEKEVFLTSLPFNGKNVAKVPRNSKAY